jgi:hypothetical protein
MPQGKDSTTCLLLHIAFLGLIDGDPRMIEDKTAIFRLTVYKTLSTFPSLSLRLRVLWSYILYWLLFCRILLTSQYKILDTVILG